MVQFFESGKKLPKAIRQEEFKELVKAIPNKPRLRKVKAGFLLAYGSGLRVSEIIHLQPTNIKETMIEVLSGKGDKDRMVPIPKGWKLEYTKEIPLKTTQRSLERNFKNFLKLAGLPNNYTFHSLRHGFATRLIESGVPISHVQVLMGHSNLATTSIYTKARPMDALKSYEDLF